MPMLAVKLENCPYCNEPPIHFHLRVDFVPKGGGIAKRCLGQPVRGETVDVDMDREEDSFVKKETKDPGTPNV